MIPSTNAALDALFADESQEIVERVIRPYQAILNRAITVRLRESVQLDLDCDVDFAPWREGDDEPPAQGLGPLTAVQVALLGGTRPTRTLEEIAAGLDLPVDGGDREGEKKVSGIFDTLNAVQQLVTCYQVAKVKGRAARARKIREFTELAVATQFASLMGFLSSEDRELLHDTEPELVERYFQVSVQVFQKLKLTRKAQEIFRDHYVYDREIEDIAEDGERTVDQESERLLGFLKGLAKALAEAVRHPEGDAPARGALPGGEPPPRVLSQATAPAARRRTR